MALGLLTLVAPAWADLTGFGDFAPINAIGHGTSVGYSTDKIALTLTDGGTHEATSGFGTAPQRVTSFRAVFTYQATSLGGLHPPGGGDGAAFVLQNDPRGAQALGEDGGGLGYGRTGGITRSVALRLGLFPESGQGVGAGGADPANGDTGDVDLRSGHPVQVTPDYARTSSPCA